EREAFEENLKRWKKKPDPATRPEEPTKPIEDRIVVGDTTTEALTVILQRIPRGVVMVRDELAALVSGLNQYKNGQGSDLQFYLSCWSGASTTNDRKGDGDNGGLRLDHPFLGIIGCLTPAKLSALRGDQGRKKADDDGFLDRFLFAYPARVPAVKEQWNVVPRSVVASWEGAVKRLRLLQMIDHAAGGIVVGKRPHFLRMTQKAKDAYTEFTADHANELNGEGFPDYLRGPWSKLQGYSLRLALILHLLDWAVGQEADDKADLGEEAMRRAITLVGYFKEMAKRVHLALDRDPNIELARKAWEWIAREAKNKRGDPFQFKAWEIVHAIRSKIVPDTDTAEKAVEILCKRNLVRAMPTVEKLTAGRKPALSYQANPKAVETIE
ncbi:MAG: DUF3987 domain-containing protein, partial [Gemmataceae bacterium]|nr:DUF3987 domain-containing protein [Gemmataceae bacterium]